MPICTLTLVDLVAVTRCALVGVDALATHTLAFVVRKALYHIGSIACTIPGSPFTDESAHVGFHRPSQQCVAWDKVLRSMLRAVREQKNSSQIVRRTKMPISFNLQSKILTTILMNVNYLANY